MFKLQEPEKRDNFPKRVFHFLKNCPRRVKKASTPYLSQDAEVVVECRQLRKSYGKHEVLKGVSAQVKKGQIVCILGPNGAGKTTLIQCLTGLSKPDQGRVQIMGFRPTAFEARQVMGCTPQETDFPESIRVGEILQFVASHYPQPLQPAELLDRLHMQDVQFTQAKLLSGGQQRKLALACAMIGNPKLMILDEPTVALDVKVRRQIWEEIKQFRAQGKAVLLSTHHLEEAEALSDDILILHEGEAICRGTPQQMKAKLGYSKVEFESPEDISFSFEIKKKFREGDHTIILTKHTDRLIQELAIGKLAFKNLFIQPASLEEVFLELIEKKDQHV